jgi:hypothetical protein
MPVYLVESYATESVVRDQRERAELAAAPGTGVTYIRTTILPGDQTLLHLFEAASPDVLRAAVAAAALDCDRIVEVVEAWAHGQNEDQMDLPVGQGSRRSPKGD